MNTEEFQNAILNWYPPSVHGSLLKLGVNDAGGRGVGRMVALKSLGRR